MRVLSLTACSRLATRLVHQAGEPVVAAHLVRQLEQLEIETTRAQAGVRLALIGNRLERVEIDGEHYVRIPDLKATAA